MAGQGKCVLFLAGQLVFLSYIFSCDAHVLFAKGIGQAICQEAVFKRNASQFFSETAVLGKIGSLAHDFNTASHHHILITGQDRLGCQLDGL